MLMYFSDITLSPEVHKYRVGVESGLPSIPVWGPPCTGHVEAIWASFAAALFSNDVRDPANLFSHRQCFSSGKHGWKGPRKVI